MENTLKKRMTFKYVGAYNYLDEWQDVAVYKEIGFRALPVEHENDLTEPRCCEVFVLVSKKTGDVGDIKNALFDTYSKSGCGHDYDCCGCRSYSVDSVERVCGSDEEPVSVWRVEVHSSLNY